MHRVISCSGSVKEYSANFDSSLAGAPRTCTCGGYLNGHGGRLRWIVCLEGVRHVRIRRMRCKACGGIVLLLPSIFHAFVTCARDLAGRIKLLWQDGRHAMNDVRRTIEESCGLTLALASMYRWARLAVA